MTVRYLYKNFNLYGIMYLLLLSFKKHINIEYERKMKRSRGFLYAKLNKSISSYASYGFHLLA